MSAAVLVTGATGFVGRAVARRLLAAGHPILVLARARPAAHAADRVAAALGTPRGDPRVQVVEGDLAEPGCGLDAHAWRRLRASADVIVHCAGDATFTPARLEPFERSHVAGPRRLLEELAPGRLRRFVHVSTAYVCGRRRGVVLESEADVGQAFHNVYERVKLASESALRAAGARAGVDVRVARPAIVAGPAPATAGGAPSNLFLDFIRMTAGLAALGEGRPVPLRIEAAPDAPFNLVPVDYVAAALVHLAAAEAGDGGTFHLVVDDAPTQAAVLATLTRRLGVRGLSLVRRLDDPTPLERRVARMLGGYREYLARPVVFDDRAARRILPPDVRSLATLSPAALHALVDLALAADDRRAAVAVRA